MSEEKQSLRLLVVDDERGPRRAAARLLRRRLGVEVREAGGAIEALTAWRREGGFAGAVIDLDMPEMDGAELLTRFRKLAPEMPVVIWTGRPLNELVAGLEHARAVIPKASSERALVDAVGQALGLTSWASSESGQTFAAQPAVPQPVSGLTQSGQTRTDVDDDLANES